METSQVAKNLSETEVESASSAGEFAEAESGRLVPVLESIRYRKRAQSAEKRAEELAAQLDAANHKVGQMAEQMTRLDLEHKLTRKLASAGAVDLETAVLIAGSRLRERGDSDVDGCIEQLKREKHYLFACSAGAATAKTAGARDRAAYPQAALDRAAKRASQTGNRADLQEYLRLRRAAL